MTKFRRNSALAKNIVCIFTKQVDFVFVYRVFDRFVNFFLVDDRFIVDLRIDNDASGEVPCRYSYN